jgi:hypothetical protein
MRLLGTGAIAVLFASAVEANALIFAGVPISPGATVRADVPLSAQEKLYASDATQNVPSHAVAVIAIPKNFDPHKTWPVLVVFSTSDFKRLNRNDLVDFYRSAALSQGWVILAGDGREFAPRDTNGWRAAMTLAALDALHNSFPGSAQWPVAIAGFSGGAKRASLMAPLLFLEGCRLSGIYLSGVNEGVLSVSYRRSRIGPEFLKIPVFISSGLGDNIAPTNRAREVESSIKHTGFQHVHFETFREGHAVKNDHTIKALRWFRESQKSVQ